MEYYDGTVALEGFYAFDSKVEFKRPLVLVCHDWSGCNEFAHHKAEKLAELGYVGFALDMYGKGQLGKTAEEKMALMKPFMDDRALLRKRIFAALDAARKLEMVDTKQIGAIGFCFGGLCALDLARSGTDLKGVVSFHGLLGAPDKLKKEKIHAKVLALHGYDDPMGPAQQVSAFQKEMTDAGVDWQMNIYGNTKHAFTNPQAHDSASGLVYNALADRRSWFAMKDFFAEIFA